MNKNKGGGRGKGGHLEAALAEAQFSDPGFFYPLKKRIYLISNSKVELLLKEKRYFCSLFTVVFVLREGLM